MFLSASTEPVQQPSLARLLWVRAVLMLVLALGAAIAPRALGLEFARRPLLLIFFVMLALTAIGWWRARSSRSISQFEIWLQLLADIAALAAGMYFSGGYMNPLISLMLLPLVSAAVTLRAAYSWLLALVTIAAYTLLMEYYQPLRLVGSNANMFKLHLIGMWVTFVVSALLVAFFMQRISASARQREIALARAREQMLRQQHVVALGAQAAGAAHELGTPLTTMAVVARELELDLAGDGNAQHAQDITALQQQIAACKNIVARLQQRADAGERRELGLDAYLRQIIEHWRLIRPAAACRLELAGATAAPLVAADAALSQAIINLLNNAADASNEPIVLQAAWSARDITLTVRDHGPGVPSTLLQRLGHAPVTTKQGGHAGLGLVLVRTTADYFAGDLRLRNCADGGLSAELVLPLARCARENSRWRDTVAGR